MLNKDPRDERMTRDGGSHPENLVPGHFVVPYESVITIADVEDSLSLKFPYMRVGTCSLKDVFCVAGLLPCPATIRRR